MLPQVGDQYSIQIILQIFIIWEDGPGFLSLETNETWP